ncbi:hypothetical protein [Yersinia pseudotuberculosis]|uniref:hypothetical protein n=1 Tax=Yersinia pseudotuberculosis TaxID=633 RepID=UPI0005AD6860|nr:hypothetical protein [Yersinia pseudotuberculosis]AJJ70737.1 putative bacteriophage tail fiber protein [Yersinia pseudotuberculosis]CNK95326.1 tail fiber repeat 2-containing protein [Yersinia pseudotuberculosis]
MQKIGDIPNTRADSNGEFTDGNVAAGVPPTILPAEWFNTIQRELMSILSAADIEADSEEFDQISQAILKLVSSGIDANKFLKTDNNLSEIAAAGPNSVLAAITNLNLLTTVNNASGALQVTRNLSDLNDKAAARTNLGLGGASSLNVGTTAGTVAAGNDSRIVNALQSNSNLSDVPNKPAARGNLGLGNSSVLNTANNAEMAAGSSTTLLPTVAAVMSLFSKRSLGTIDYIRIPDVPGGILIQFGTVGVPPGTGQSTVSANFAIPFTTPPRGFSATCYGGANYFTFGANPTITGFTGFAFDRITTAATLGTVFFIAIGN